MLDNERRMKKWFPFFSYIFWVLWVLFGTKFIFLPEHKIWSATLSFPSNFKMLCHLIIICYNFLTWFHQKFHEKSFQISWNQILQRLSWVFIGSFEINKYYWLSLSLYGVFMKKIIVFSNLYEFIKIFKIFHLLNLWLKKKYIQNVLKFRRRKKFKLAIFTVESTSEGI